VVANDSHSKINELDDKVKALERLYQGLHNKFLEAFPSKGDALQANPYHVFLTGRDSVKTRCSRGGGVLIAVRRGLRCTAIHLQNDSSLLI